MIIHEIVILRRAKLASQSSVLKYKFSVADDSPDLPMNYIGWSRQAWPLLFPTMLLNGVTSSDHPAGRSLELASPRIFRFWWDLW